jgi:hypothetical protein
METATLFLALSAVTTAHASGKSSDPVAAYVDRTLHVTTYKRADTDLNGDSRSEAFIYVTDASAALVVARWWSCLLRVGATAWSCGQL